MERIKKIIKTASNPLIDVILESDAVIEPLDLSDIHVWAEKNIVLAGQFNPCGPYRSSRSPYIIEPLRAVKDHTVREVTCLAATQTAKTVFLLLAGMWILVNRPLPMMLIMQTNSVASDLLTSRLMPTMKASKVMDNMLPTDKNKIKMPSNAPNSIHFDHVDFYVNGCSLNNLQSRPLGVILADEVWAWDGAPIEHARKRMGSYATKKMDKLIVCSQGGEMGSDITKLYLEGTQEVWHVPCEGCGTHFIPSFQLMSADGISWSDPKAKIKDLDGTYNWALLEEKLCMSCPSCGHKHRDSDQLKRKWKDHGKYIQTNPKASKERRSFNWSAYIERPWNTIIREFINASHMMKLGVLQPIKDFFWQTEPSTKPVENIFNKDVKIISGDYNPKDKWEHEHVRFMTIDVQKDRYCYLIRAWAKDGRSRLLTYAYVNTIQDVIDAQQEWGVPSYYTWIDTNHRTQEVYRHIVDNGWVGIRGEGDRDWGYKHDVYDANGNKLDQKITYYWKKCEVGGDTGYPDKDLPLAEYYFFAVNKIKDILVRLRNGHAAEWLCLPSDKYDIVEYTKQMKSEWPCEERDKMGRYKTTWKKINKNEPNECWDLECYQIGMALIHQEISIKENLIAPGANYIRNST